MTTTEAFKQLINDTNLQKNLNPSTVGSWKHRLAKGKVTINAMEKALLKAGATKKPEVWSFKKQSKNG